MLKKLSLLFAAFVLGIVISLAIQACGNDKVDTGRSSSGSGSDASCNCGWASQNFASYITYDENGLELDRTDYEYDNLGRVIGYKYLFYTTSVSGQRYLGYEQKVDYTYADSDNIRYGTTTSVYYDENGAITSQGKSTDKAVLYK